MLEDEIADYLAANGLGTPGQDLFEIRSPDLPDTLTTVRGYPGLPPMKVQNLVGAALERPSLQITCRALASDVAMNRALAIYRALMTIRNQTLSGTWYTHVTPQSPPSLIGFDQKGRTEVGFNSQVEKGVSA